MDLKLFGIDMRIESGDIDPTIATPDELRDWLPRLSNFDALRIRVVIRHLATSDVSTENAKIIQGQLRLAMCIGRIHDSSGVVLEVSCTTCVRSTFTDDLQSFTYL